ncbi:MAG: flagellar biosynthesis anti-sigma factor FlgM [Chloroflexota bacterium]|nr:flagellar biosynthesis anti-sigma factor FlgM [Dehalococcoidia bacterium]MDW8254881.1 flagellar biosynthesis anti-sigma factor FlgM [Chloroflexota bacterium]
MAIERMSLNLTRLAASHAYGVPAPAGAPSSTVERSPAPRRDGVELSATGRDLQAARAAIASLPEVREDRVAQIKAALAAGTYHVSSAALAQKLLGLA